MLFHISLGYLFCWLPLVACINLVNKWDEGVISWEMVALSLLCNHCADMVKDLILLWPKFRFSEISTCLILKKSDLQYYSIKENKMIQTFLKYELKYCDSCHELDTVLWPLFFHNLTFFPWPMVPWSRLLSCLDVVWLDEVFCSFS